MISYIPFMVGLAIAFMLYLTVGWWGFLVLFPWIGLGITVGIRIDAQATRAKKGIGRRIAMLIIMPSLFLFVPFANHENFQMEGVALLLLVGFFSKGVIHYAVAKVFGPLIWGRGFCGWACWTAAVLEWLPKQKNSRPITPVLKRLRFVSLIVSLAIPAVLVFAYSYDVRHQYIEQREIAWMFVSNAAYYALAIPIAFYFSDRRAFCKILCPVSLVMKVPSSFALIRRRPSGVKCTECGICNSACQMDIDVRSYISAGHKVSDTECILCYACKQRCPVKAIL